MERAAVQVCTAVDHAKDQHLSDPPPVRVREIFHYPKRENFKARTTALADGATRQHLGLKDEIASGFPSPTQ
jgi:hypothetical protein